MTRIYFAFLFLTFAFGLSAQNYTSTADNDPEAKAILDGVSQKYEAYQSMEAKFVMAVEIPQQNVDYQEIIMQRNGEKYRVFFGTQEMFSDGDALYMVLHQNKSVQINDLPESTEGINFLTPESLFSFYESGEFIYTLMDTRSEDGSVNHYIEFKPTDSYSEYSKLRMVVNKNTSEIVRIKAFAKDGSRYTLSMDNFVANKNFEGDYFTFSDAKYPGYHTEDFREDD